ncbi:MAG: hypothetical protein OEV92_02975 [Nitrospinota bacterium]|nr:hypothetical protein [Nitrospinota bacterium]
MHRSGFIAALILASALTATFAQGQGLGSLISPGPLAKPHAEVEGLTNCVKCHALGAGVPTEKCYECHKDILARVTDKKGYHAKVSKKECHDCHEDHKGLDYAMIQWPGKDINKFEHKETDYPLDGKHEQVKCEGCHTAKTKQGLQSFFLASTTCLACHQKNDVHKGALGEKCESCHTTNSWKGKDLKFDHDKAYKLEWTHIKTPCEKCHPVKGQFKVPGFEKCVTCHQKDDVHKGALGDLCDKCHVAKTWKGQDVLLNHDKFYKLDTGHVKTKCEKCHPVKGQFKVAGFEKCVTCHRKDDLHKGTLGDACDKCHVARTWKGSDLRFDHDKPYKLEKSHANVKCEKCHTVKGQYKSPGFEKCVSCHKKDDVHKGSLGDACEKCHDEGKWKEARIDHSKTKYPLEGKHLKVECAKCHPRAKDKIYAIERFDRCSSSGCHDVRARGDVHGAQFRGSDCKDCHTLKGWEPPTFLHSAPEYKGYKLEGKHGGLACAKCHAKDIFGIVLYKPIRYDTCMGPGCHDTSDRGAIHGKQFQGSDCNLCHNMDGWKPPIFSHDSPSYSGYKLFGKHRQVKCEECHKKSFFGVVHYKPIAGEKCDSCHKDPHRGQFGSTACSDCHTEDDWKKLRFDHNRNSRFALYGKHDGLACAKCHEKETLLGKATVWKPLDRECYACHADKDKHKGAFGKNCDQCHNEKTWKTDRFAHELTGFRLEYAHLRLKCGDCHNKKDNFAGLGQDCANCHTDPHFNQFGSFCGDCHNARDWEPRKFNHAFTGFRLEGAHRVLECKTCHANRLYRNVRSDCLSCHRDAFFSPNAAAIHSPSNTECQTCHMPYSWLPASGHMHQFMTFTGAHAGAQGNCDACHTGNYQLKWPGAKTEQDCEFCHMSDYRKEHRNCPTTCGMCHNTSSFDHGRETIKCD